MKFFVKVFVRMMFLLTPVYLNSVAYGQGNAIHQPSQNVWQKVPERDKVCMVTDMLFNRPQIPVSVGAKTYYGCCHGCKDRLANDASVRFGTDPVTGKKVDKALAVIAAGPDGSVTYFESEATLKTFLSAAK